MRKDWLMAVAFMGCAGVCHGAGIADVSRNVTESIKGILSILEGGAILAGVVCTMSGLMKTWQHYQNPHQVRLGSVLPLFVIGACLGAMGAFLEMQTGTLFGSSTPKRELPRI